LLSDLGNFRCVYVLPTDTSRAELERQVGWLFIDWERSTDEGATVWISEASRGYIAKVTTSPQTGRLIFSLESWQTS